MSKPPDELCICALTSKAYPGFTDQQVLDVCADHWETIRLHGGRPDYSPDEAVMLTMEIVRSTNPGAKQLAIIESIEATVAERQAKGSGT